MFITFVSLYLLYIYLCASYSYYIVYIDFQSWFVRSVFGLLTSALLVIFSILLYVVLYDCKLFDFSSTLRYVTYTRMCMLTVFHYGSLFTPTVWYSYHVLGPYGVLIPVIVFGPRLVVLRATARRSILY